MMNQSIASTEIWVILYVPFFFLTRITNYLHFKLIIIAIEHFYEANFSFRSRAEQLIEIFIDKITIKSFTGSAVVWKKTNRGKEYCSTMSNKIKPPSVSLCIRKRFIIKMSMVMWQKYAYPMIHTVMHITIRKFEKLILS